MQGDIQTTVRAKFKSLLKRGVAFCFLLSLTLPAYAANVAPPRHWSPSDINSVEDAGCVLGNSDFDPLLPLLIIVSAAYLICGARKHKQAAENPKKSPAPLKPQPK